MPKKSALLLGATGLVGSHLLTHLLESNIYEDVRLITRRKVEQNHPKLKQYVADFEHLDALCEVFKVDDVFCCLGTTIKQAKSKAMFRKVDYDYIVQVAQLSKKQKVQCFLLLSSIGANPNSPVFYLQIKGETEVTIQHLNLPNFQVFRPSLLLGKRSDFRIAEACFSWMSPCLALFLQGPLKRFRPVKAETVAQKMLLFAQNDTGPLSISYF